MFQQVKMCAAQHRRRLHDGGFSEVHTGCQLDCERSKDCFSFLSESYFSNKIRLWLNEQSLSLCLAVLTTQSDCSFREVFRTRRVVRGTKKPPGRDFYFPFWPWKSFSNPQFEPCPRNRSRVLHDIIGAMT